MLEPYEISNKVLNLGKKWTEDGSPMVEFLDAVELMADAIEEGGEQALGTLTNDAWNDAALYMLTMVRFYRGGFRTNDVEIAARLENVPKAAAAGGFMNKWKAYEAGVPLEDIRAGEE